ncbi:MAG: pilus assembly protein TadG-related protein, partial [Planctomycetota bacterium]
MKLESEGGVMWYQKSFCSCMAQRIVGRARRGLNKTSSWNRTRGVAIVWAAFMLFMIVGVMGFGLDGARLYIDAHQLQNAADAAALAGAQYVKVGYLAGADIDPTNDLDYPAVVFRVTQEIANQNRANLATVNLDVPNISAFDQTVDVVIGYYLMQTREFTPFDPTVADPKAPNAVKVVARQTLASAVNAPVPLIFGSIFGVDTADVERLAIAISVGSTGAGLIALTEYPGPMPQPETGLQIGGGSTVNVNNGDVQVNSWSDDQPWSAVRMSNNTTLNTDEMNVVGGTSPDPDDPFWDTQDYNVNSYTEDPLDDPLAGVPELYPDLMPAIPLVDPITGDSTADWTADIVDSAVIAAEAQQTYTDADGENWKVLTLAPGYYPGGIRMTSASTSVQVGTETVIDPNGDPIIIPIFETYRLKLELQSGVYALGGDNGPVNNPGTGLFINGGTFEAVGVMLYITQSQTGVYGAVDIRGGTQT